MRVSMTVMFVWEEEYIVLDFPANGGVPADDISKGGLFQAFDLILRKDIEIKEPVAVPQSFKLIHEDDIK